MKIDWTNIEGYREDMSADEKLELLDGYTPPTTEPETTTETKPTTLTKDAEKPVPTTASALKPGYISKREFDKVSSQLAEAKRQLRSKMSEEEAREADRQAQVAAQEEELKSLRRDKTLANHKASFMGLGLADELAAEAATSLADGDNDGLFDALKRYQIGFEKALRAKILADTPKPPSGQDPNSEESKKQDKENLRRLFGLPPKP